MKKISLLILGLAFVTFTSCKKEEKTETPTETKEEVKDLTIVNDSTKVKWTGFKTTDKVAVNGIFKEIELKNVKTGNTPEEVKQDEEGLQIMRTLGNNMAWLLKCIEAGKKAGIDAPETEQKIMTNFIR